MAKYYRVKKDTPMWIEGAIIFNSDYSEKYRATQDIWTRVEGTEGWTEGDKLVENNPDWYERVYPIDLITKTVYKLKEQALEFYSKQVTE